MLTRGVPLKTVILLVILLIPLLLSGLSYSQSVSLNDASYKECKASLFNSVIVAGDFQYFKVKVTDEVEKICIIAYHGDSLPDSEDCSVGNYYKWEYDHGVWRDASGHESVYIKPSQCVVDNNTYSFFIGIDAKAKPGRWTVKILIDGEEIASSTNSVLVVVQFNFFLTALIGVYNPSFRDKKSIIDIDIICSDQKRIMVESKKNIDKLVDEVLCKHTVSNQEDDSKEIHKQCFFENKPLFKSECVKSTVYTYPRSKLKNEQKNAVSSLFFKDKWGGNNGFWSNKLGVYKSFLAIMLIIILLSVSFVPIITPQDIASSSYPIISSFNVLPDSVNLSDSILLNVSVSDSVGITSVVADIGGLETINLSFVEGTIVNDTIYSGLWQNTWLVQNIDPGDYTVAVVATNKDNGSASKQYIFTVLPVDDNVNISFNNSLEPEFNESSNITQIEEQNNTTLLNNDTIQNETINSTVTQNTINTSIDNTTHSELSVSDTNATLYTNITSIDNTILVNQSDSGKVDVDEVFIVDKRHEELTILPGTRFYVERTIDGLKGTNITFAPMFSDSLTLESIEIIDDKAYSDKSNKLNVYNSGNAKNEKEQKIKHLKEKLPSKTKVLNKIAFTDNIELQSPRTIRLWFRAPSWEEMQSGVKPTSGEISYLVFSDDENESFDFEGSSWWSSGWLYRKLITVNSSQIDEDLKNFPILVSVTDNDLASDAQDDGDDIAFVLYSDNSTKLNHEIELFNGTTGQLACWVNVTSLSGSVDTKIWMYYGNSGCSNQQNPAGVWESRYIGVWHINDTGTGTRFDSTNYNNDASPSGYDGNEATSGKIDGADYLDGGNDCLSVGSSSSIDITGEITIETWINLTAIGLDQKIAGRQSGTAGGYKMGVYTDNKVEMEVRDSSNNPYLNRGVSGGTTLQQNQWYYTVGIYNDAANNITTFINGLLDRTLSTAGVLASTTGSLYFGREPFASSSYLNGKIDEIRISNIVRNTSWIQTSYNTMNNTNTFLSFGTEEQANPTISNPVPSDGAINIAVPPSIFNITINDPNGDTMNITWRTNASGYWFTFNTTNSVSNGTFNATNTSWVNSHSTKYWWSVNVSDDIFWTNTTYNFTTSYPPQINNPNPANNSITVITPICRVTVSDTDGGTLTVKFYENTTGSWVLQQINNNVDVSIPNIVSWNNYNNASSYDISYWWMVNVSDGKGCFDEEIYKFTTSSDNPPALSFENPSDESTGIKTSLSQLNVTISDLDGQTMDWSIQTSPNIGSNSGIGASNGSISCSVSGLKAGYTYTWYANVTDGIIWSNETYCFNTSFAPTISLIYPSPNGTTGIETQPWCSIWANDSDGDILNVTWATNASGSWVNVTTNNSISANSTVSHQFTEFIDYSTTYYWKVFVNDSSSNISSWYYFNSGGISSFVNTISPYQITRSPHTITASGSSNLDNVTLFYYYSSDNSTWWNSSFKYRKKITITGQAGAGTDYQVLLRIGETSGASGENFDLGGNSSNFPSGKNIGGDLRFIDDDNATLLDFWVENVTGTTPNRLANVWVEVKDNLNSNVNFYCYYGNPQATNFSNGLNTFIVFDDFEGASLDNDIWTAYSVDSMSFSSSVMTTTCTNDDPTAIIADVNGAGPTGDNIAIRSFFRATAGTHTDQRMGVKIKCSLTNGQGYTYVLHDFLNTDEITFLDDMVAWGTIQENDFTMNVWYTFEICHDGTNIRARRDDGVWRTWIRSGRSGYPALNPGGYSNTATGQWDWAVIRKCIATEPSFNSATEESWIKWNSPSNPDSSAPWSWSFNFPEGDGYYQFYSTANKTGYTNETTPNAADAICYYKLSVNSPVINSYDLRNNTGSKLNNNSGLIDVNCEYIFTINITDPDGWLDIEYINITSWYDFGSETSFYNQTSGGNLNIFLQYKNITGTAYFRMLWPNNESQLVQTNCTEMIINSYTHIINISFKPLSQIRWACSNNTWNTTADVCNDPYSWNFNITVTDETNLSTWKVNEFGVYKYTYILPSQDWVDVYALPGFSDSSNVVTITYSSNYNFKMKIYFEENLYNQTLGETIPIANNVDILAGADPNDDISTDKTFLGIGEVYAIYIFNESGIFKANNVSQTVNVQFDVYIPLATLGGKYIAHVNTKIIQD